MPTFCPGNVDMDKWRHRQWPHWPLATLATLATLAAMATRLTIAVRRIHTHAHSERRAAAARLSPKPAVYLTAHARNSPREGHLTPKKFPFYGGSLVYLAPHARKLVLLGPSA